MLLRCHNVKNVKKNQSSYRRKIQQNALRKVNRVKEIMRTEKDGLFRQLHFVLKSIFDIGWEVDSKLTIP